MHSICQMVCPGDWRTNRHEHSVKSFDLPVANTPPFSRNMFLTCTIDCVKTVALKIRTPVPIHCCCCRTIAYTLWNPKPDKFLWPPAARLNLERWTGNAFDIRAVCPINPTNRSRHDFELLYSEGLLRLRNLGASTVALTRIFEKKKRRKNHWKSTSRY